MSLFDAAVGPKEFKTCEKKEESSKAKEANVHLIGTRKGDKWIELGQHAGQHSETQPEFNPILKLFKLCEPEPIDEAGRIDPL